MNQLFFLIAWYQATSSNGASVAAFTAVSVATAKETSYTYTTGDLTFTLLLTPTASSSLIEASWDDTNDKWEVYYVKADGSLIADEDLAATGIKSGQVKSKAYQVKAYANREITSDDLAIMGTAKDTLSVEPALTNGSGDEDSRILWWTSTSALVDNCDYSATTTALTITITTGFSHDSDSPESLGYVAVAYEGETTPVAGKYTADVAAPSIKIGLTGSLV